jgi:hypothetical protein
VRQRCPVSLDLVRLHLGDLRRARSGETPFSGLSHLIWSAMAVLSAVSHLIWSARAILSVTSHPIWLRRRLAWGPDARHHVLAELRRFLGREDRGLPQIDRGDELHFPLNPAGRAEPQLQPIGARRRRGHEGPLVDADHAEAGEGAVPVDVLGAGPVRHLAAAQDRRSWQVPLRLRGGVDHRMATVFPAKRCTERSAGKDRHRSRRRIATPPTRMTACRRRLLTWTAPTLATGSRLTTAMATHTGWTPIATELGATASVRDTSQQVPVSDGRWSFPASGRGEQGDRRPPPAFQAEPVRPIDDS